MKRFLPLSLILLATGVFVHDAIGFEGKIVYAIRNDGVDWKYTLWMKGTQWRSELRQGEQVFEVRIGNKADKTAYLVNEAAKSYRPLGMGPMGGMDGKIPPGPPGNKSDSRNPKPLAFEKVVKAAGGLSEDYGYETKRYLLKGPGKPVELVTTEALPPFPEAALPRFQLMEKKREVFRAFFQEKEGFLLSLVERGNSEKKGFSMEFVSEEQLQVDERFVTLREGFQPLLRSGAPRGGGKGGPRPRGRGGPPPM